MKITTLQNAKLKPYMFELYKLCIYSQKEW